MCGIIEIREIKNEFREGGYKEIIWSNFKQLLEENNIKCEWNSPNVYIDQDHPKIVKEFGKLGDHYYKFRQYWSSLLYDVVSIYNNKELDKDVAWKNIKEYLSDRHNISINSKL